MIEIEPVQLNITLPNDNIGVVVMHPFVELNDYEPFHWQSDKKSKQIERIIRTLEIAIRADHNCEKTHFTVFPEYSIPGLEGVSKIQEILETSSWKDGTIVIGGVDGLTKGQYVDLCSQNNTYVFPENKPERIREPQWINCGITWVKEADNLLQKWVQPKLVPSWLEKSITCNYMFPGNSVHIFKCKFKNDVDCHFLSLLCFDWIGEINSRKGIGGVLYQINEYWKPSGRKDIHFIFIPQKNDEPNHRDFLENTRHCFEERDLYPFTDRDNCVIIFVNSAGGPLPGKYSKFGFSSVLSSPNSPYDIKGCPPTFSVRTTKLRGTDNLGRCKDALFREIGACIHSFEICHPSFVNLEPPGRSFIIKEANVHAIDQNTNDPRVPGHPVPASIKWINDQLDAIKPILHHEEGSSLREVIEGTHREISEEIRICSDEFLCKSIEKAVYNYDKWIELGERKVHDVDNWEERERGSLETVTYSLSILKACKQLSISNSLAHGTIKHGSNVIDVIIVCGGDTSDRCMEYGAKFLLNPQRFAIIITRDTHERPVHKKDKLVFEPENEITDKGPNFTDPGSTTIHCGYSNLKDACFGAVSLPDLSEQLSDIIGI